MKLGYEYCYLYAALNPYSASLFSLVLPDRTTESYCAFTHLYNGYAPALFNVICRYTKNESRSEDILQEVFCKIWQHIELYDASKGRLFTWLLNITRNTAIDWTRSNKYKEDQRTFAFHDSDGGSFCPYHFFEAKDIRKVISSMSYQHRNIIELTYFYGFTHKQIAELLQLSLGTVKSKIRIAAKQLRVVLADEYQNCV
ncbi:MAG: sigma-70 family RNA polymerase sigma factor [Flavisolibacter sp.]|nr:sigma-70 family RNA polymerase sigma factor [Flavisolibacter sp.]